MIVSAVDTCEVLVSNVVRFSTRLTDSRKFANLYQEVSRPTLRIGSEHWRDRITRLERHGVGGRVVQFTILSTLAPRPGCADDEDVACGGGGLCLITARYIHCLKCMLVSGYRQDEGAFKRNIGGVAA